MSRSRSTHPFHSQLFVLVLALVQAAACYDDAGVSVVVAGTSTDSAGIHIVENLAVRGRPMEWLGLDTVPLLIVGASNPESTSAVILGRVQALAVLRDDHIVVADNGIGQAMIFDSTGRLMSRFARRGQGPGELAEIRGVSVCGRDTIAVLGYYDVLLFDASGRLGRQARFRAPGGPFPAGPVSTDCGRVLVRAPLAQTIGTWGPVQEQFIWLDPAAGTADTLMTSRLQEGWTREFEGAAFPWPIPWGTSASTFAYGASGLWVGYGRIPELRKFDAGRTVAIVRWAQEAHPIGGADLDRYTEAHQRWRRTVPDEPEVDFIFPPLERFPELPKEMPLFDRVIVGDDGGLWIRKFNESSLGVFDERSAERPRFSYTWMVFDAEGVRLGELSMPVGFELHAVHDGKLYGVGHDELDVETIQVFRLYRSTALSS